MEGANKKRAIFLGIRVGAISLIAIIAVVVISYYVLSQNFQSLLTEYSITMIESMNNQGVRTIENEIDTRKQWISSLATSFGDNGENIGDFQLETDDNYLRMLYVTENQTFSSDGRNRHVYGRQDINEAFLGEVCVYGPYFNEENEYVVCYSAPVRGDEEVVGVLSVEMDGYIFCDLIEGIRFMNSGEAYIINSQGTDIAVSDKNHIDWVNNQYNAREILESQFDSETKSIMELEQKGLDGQTGVDTYYWKDGLCYVAYQPIPSVNWVFLSGMREEELVAITQNAIFTTISQGPVIEICFIAMFILIGLIVYWIISSMKKNIIINEKLELLANYDGLTNLKNRNCFHHELDKLSQQEFNTFVCVYIDVNGLHDLNNHLGHQAGDQMLVAVARALEEQFAKEQLYRIGGDEFIVMAFNIEKDDLDNRLNEVRNTLYGQNYEISVGVAYQSDEDDLMSVINKAEVNMQSDKQRYYNNNGHERRMRGLNEKLEKMISDKQDADTFLSVLAPDFCGVYFVNLSTDDIRHLYIPDYFEECLKEENDKFSKALILYAKRKVKPKYFDSFIKLCDYDDLERRLDKDEVPELIYQKKGEEWIRLKILKFKGYSSKQRETLWIFSNVDETKKK